MKIAIHKSEIGFHPHWVAYCKLRKIPYKIVDCYDTNLIANLKDCKALMWHHSQGNAKDLVISKQILFALEHNGFIVFPNFNTAWHFDNKVAQKYLFESFGVPHVPSYSFFDKKVALDWANKTTFPKVFKLKGGAGSSNVKLIRTKKEAISTIHTAFGKGFSNYDALGSIKERWRKWRLGKVSFFEVLKGLIRFFKYPDFAKVQGKELNYAYFQDFIPNNKFDIRIIVIDDKAFALKRFVRENDFRASGSGSFSYDRSEFDENWIAISFEIAKKMNAQCSAFDFVFDKNNQPLIVEVSYGFLKEGYDLCPGYWDSKLNWIEGRFNPQGWMVDTVVKEMDKL